MSCKCEYELGSWLQEKEDNELGHWVSTWGPPKAMWVFREGSPDFNNYFHLANQKKPNPIDSQNTNKKVFNFNNWDVHGSRSELILA